MTKLDLDFLEKIERIFNVKFLEWQVDYILECMRITGRGTDNPFSHITKMLEYKEKTI